MQQGHRTPYGLDALRSPGPVGRFVPGPDLPHGQNRLFLRARPDRGRPSMMMAAWIHWSLINIPLFAVAIASTHLVMSCGQTLMHYWLGHRRIGGALFRNHINFHHAYYSRGHLASPVPEGSEGNNTPWFIVPIPFSLPPCCALVRSASGVVHRGNPDRGGVVPRPCLVRQGVSRRGFVSRAFRMVSAQTAASLRSPSAREQQFRGGRFLLGPRAWHLSESGPGRAVTRAYAEAA